MDGVNSTILANGTWVTWPNALAIDYANQVLYWGDARRDVIGRMNTDGSGIEIITDLMQTLQRIETASRGLCLIMMGIFIGVIG